MSKERYINAEALIRKLNYLSTQFYGYSQYGSGQIESYISSQIQTAVSMSLKSFIKDLTSAIDECATLDGPCFLCRQKEGECVPPNLYGDTGKTSA